MVSEAPAATNAATELAAIELDVSTLKSQILNSSDVLGVDAAGVQTALAELEKLRGEQVGDAADPGIAGLRDDDVVGPVGEQEEVATVGAVEVDARVVERCPGGLVEEAMARLSRGGPGAASGTPGATPTALSQLLDVLGDDDAATAAEDFDMGGAALVEQIHHVLEELDVAALVGRDADALGVLLDGGVDDFLDRAVVAEVDDLRSLRLEDSAHDVDGRVVAVEERGGGDEANLRC